MPRLLLYKLDASPPASAVRVLAEMLGLQLELKNLDFVNLEHKSPEYMKLNPMGTIPTFADDDFVISDSNAIMKYLLGKYGGDKGELLYPSDLRVRAIMDQCLFFNAGVFFVRLKVVVLPTLFGGLKEPTAKHIQDIEDAFGVVEAYLEPNKYIACDHLTLADIAVGSTAATIQCIHKLDAARFPRTAKWLELLYSEPSFKKYIGYATELLTQVYTSVQEKNKTL